MSHQGVPRIRRLYLRFASAEPGMMRIVLSATQPDTPAMAVLITRGMLHADEQELSLGVVSDPSEIEDLRGPPGRDGDPGTPGLPGAKGDAGQPGATNLGTVALERSVGIALALGDRDFDVTVPGLKKNDSIFVTPIVTTANPNALPAGWAYRGAIAFADNTLRLRMTNPLLVLNAAYSMSFRVVRLNF